MFLVIYLKALCRTDPDIGNLVLLSPCSFPGIFGKPNAAERQFCFVVPNPYKIDLSLSPLESNCRAYGYKQYTKPLPPSETELCDVVANRAVRVQNEEERERERRHILCNILIDVNLSNAKERRNPEKNVMAAHDGTDG